MKRKDTPIFSDIDEENLLLANFEALKYKTRYFQARDEIRKANKGLARLSRHNQVLRNRVIELSARTPQGVDSLMADVFKAYNGNSRTIEGIETH